MIRLFFVRFNNKKFNNKREFVLSLRVYLIKLYLSLNVYIVLIFFFKYKILILLIILSHFFRDSLYVFKTLIAIMIKTLN